MTGKLPQRVFIFRGGISEGQFDITLRGEFSQNLEAFRKVEAQKRQKYRPQLSIVICGKRHHARFFATDSQFAEKNGNTRPGTVVDKGVTAVFDFDFYLQAHTNHQGTTRATHYTVVYDENAFKADEIQGGIHDFCYLYARATSVVSLIPAAYYADLACSRARCYLNEFFFGQGGLGSSVASGGRGGTTKEQKIANFKQAKRAWGRGLHVNMRDGVFHI